MKTTYSLQILFLLILTALTSCLEKDNFCWVMRVPSTFHFPLESNDIRQSYKEFEKWITDPGYEWYENGIPGKIK